jgi:methanogenic corrinoid protein MtbC1
MNQSILTAAMSRIDGERVLSIAKNMLEKDFLPMNIIEEVRKGMTLVRKRYEEGKYFLSDLMISAEIFTEVIELLKLNGSENEPIADSPIIMGTVQNDIHDIGKNIIIQLLQLKGFRVIDLGVDVSPTDFVQSAIVNKSKILFMSGLLTLAYDSMKMTVQEFEKNSYRNNITIVIGGLVDERVKNYVRADYCTKDSQVAINLCQNILIPDNNIVLKDTRAVSK